MNNCTTPITVSDEFIREFQDEIDWRKISILGKLSENSIWEFQEQVQWLWVSMHQILSEDFIREFEDRVDWYWISTNQKLSEDFIREFRYKVEWSQISDHQKLSEDFIREFRYKVDWHRISKQQKLSEDFIREFKEKVDWFDISVHQKLSEDFIREFQDKFDLRLIVIYQQLSGNFFKMEDLQSPYMSRIISNYNKMDSDFITRWGVDISDNWLYKSTDFKKSKIEETNLYEMHDDYFIAYKGIRSDNYSSYNFQYQYFSGHVYESKADHTNAEVSFGLSAWTLDGARQYCSEKIIKVKIYYKDVARVVHDGGKIRCTRLEVLEVVE